MTVLVLSEDRDPTTDAVVDELNRRGVPLLRCDLGWFPQRLALDAELDDAGWSGTLRTPHREVTLSGLGSVWYRSPTAFAFPDELSAAERLHAAYEAKFGVGGVLWSLPLLWVNHPARQADLYKPTQLAVARSCGLAVPETLVTNRPEAVRRFAASVDGPIVIKPMGFASINEEGTRKPIYTHVLSADELADLRGVDVTAHLFQRFIADKACEVRLTVVGHRLFAAAIHAASDAARVDFRADYDALTYRIIDTPPAVAAGVRAFMDHFGLVYGAFDFAVDAAETWWTLECNPSGQYGFIEDPTGLPITSALADLLEKGTS